MSNVLHLADLRRHRLSAARQQSDVVHAQYERARAWPELKATLALRTTRLARLRVTWVLVAFATAAGGFLAGRIASTAEPSAVPTTAVAVVSSKSGFPSSIELRALPAASEPLPAVATHLGTQNDASSASIGVFTKPEVAADTSIAQSTMSKSTKAQTSAPPASPNALAKVKSVDVLAANREDGLVAQRIAKKPADPSGEFPTAVMPAPATGTSMQFRVVSVPSDGLVGVTVNNDPTVRFLRVGDRLPDGKKLVSAVADTGSWTAQ